MGRKLAIVIFAIAAATAAGAAGADKKPLDGGAVRLPFVLTDTGEGESRVSLHSPVMTEAVAGDEHGGDDGVVAVSISAPPVPRISETPDWIYDCPEGDQACTDAANSLQAVLVSALRFNEVIDASHKTPLLQHENTAAELARRWQSGNIKPRTHKGRIYYVYGAGAATIVCRVGEVCDMALDTDERIKANGDGSLLAMSDSANWQVDLYLSGEGATERQHLVFKPVRVGESDTASVYTTRRVYLLRLLSVDKTDNYTHAIGFDYPDKVALRLRHGAKQRAAREAENKRRTQVPSPVVQDATLDLADLNFGYTATPITGNPPRWSPVQIYDDGKQVYIRFPAISEHLDFPVLHVLDGDVERIVNYRQLGRTLVVDYMFEKARLSIGLDEQQQAVIITRNVVQG